jgi:hypothetical protein
MQVTRRYLLGGAASIATLSAFSLTGGAWARGKTGEPDIEKWMTEWMSVGRAPGGTLHVSRFVEPVYFLTQPIAWRPNSDQVGKFEPVEVPKGFVTDFATIPRVFWTMLRPDGEYTYAAIVHDYLYWTQTRTRDVSDQIFRHSMEDFKVPGAVATVVHWAVRTAGGSYWDDVPRARWEDWKRKSDVFA